MAARSSRAVGRNNGSREQGKQRSGEEGSIKQADEGEEGAQSTKGAGQRIHQGAASIEHKKNFKDKK